MRARLARSLRRRDRHRHRLGWDLHRGSRLHLERKQHVLIDEAVDGPTHRQNGTSAGHEKARDRDQGNRADDPGGACDALVVERAREPYDDLCAAYVFSLTAAS